MADGINTPDDPLAWDEPLFDPEDTPSRGMRPLNLDAEPDTPRSGIRVADMQAAGQPKTNPSLRLDIRRAEPRRSPAINLILLGAAALITLVAAALYMQQDDAPTRVGIVPKVAGDPTEQPTRTPQPPTTTPDVPTPAPVALVADSVVPPDVVAELLARPGFTAPPTDGIYRLQNPFTIAPARARGKIEKYRIQSGDTLEKIARRFGLMQDTLIWSNDITYVNRLQPGEELNIMPVDGVLHSSKEGETIQAIADAYKVSPYVILDSEFNLFLRNAAPETSLPAGLSIIVPGGVSEKKAVYWNPGITITKGDGGTSRSSGTISFGGGPGACGAQPNAGGTGSLRIPLPPIYRVGRGFTAYHTGVDLQAPTGTTVFAADGGTVIFAGWSNWGYGNSVVIAHGNLVTLYGHMNSINVTCGQSVGAGQPIGTVGNTGNSTGPHLHFEVRIGETPDNPYNYLAF